MVPYSMEAYRIPIDPGQLAPAVRQILEKCTDAKAAGHALGYEIVPKEIEKGYSPQKDAAKLVKMVKDSKRRAAMKDKRLLAGFGDLISPRKGIRGWIQKTFRDPDEFKLPIAFEILHWLNESPRYQYLVTLHDVLLNKVSSSEPRKISREDIISIQNPLIDMLADHNIEAAEKLSKTLAAPLLKIDPEVVIHLLSGFVVDYNAKQNFAYYYS